MILVSSDYYASTSGDSATTASFSCHAVDKAGFLSRGPVGPKGPHGAFWGHEQSCAHGRIYFICFL